MRWALGSASSPPKVEGALMRMSENQPEVMRVLAGARVVLLDAQAVRVSEIRRSAVVDESRCVMGPCYRWGGGKKKRARHGAGSLVCVGVTEVLWVRRSVFGGWRG